MAKKIADTKKMTHDEWLELRKSSIGGSDAAVCVNMNQYGSLLTLYADKTGMSKDKETSEAMRLGTDLEAYVAERFAEKTGKKVRNDFFMYADDEYEFLTANIDRRIVGENAGLECKTMGSFHGYNFDNGDVPSHYYCQVQHYMMVMGFDMVYLAILVLQRGLYVIEIKRDDDFIKTLREAEISFWKTYVEPGKMPDADGSEAAWETLKEIYPDTVPESEISIAGLDRLVTDYKAMNDLACEYEDKAEEIKSRICQKLGKNEIGNGIEYGVSWKKQSRSYFDSTRFKDDYPDLWKKYQNPRSYRVFRTRKMKHK